MIKVENITKSYSKDSKKAVNSVSFEVCKGQIVGIIGPNGSGKTTTIKMMTGIIKPDEGRIFIKGHNIVDEAIEAKMNIGYMPDSPDMFLRLKGIEYLNFVADIFGTGKDERTRRIERFSVLFGIDSVLDSQMISYSHGMRQKLMVVAALVHDPDIWILDEPLTGLDPESAFELKKLMREHADAGKCVMFSTHVLEVAQKLCDRVIIILKGKKLFDGTLDELTEMNPGKQLEEIFLEMTGYLGAEGGENTDE